MSNDLLHPLLASTAARGVPRWMIPGAILTAVAALTLAGCGPDTGAGAPTASTAVPASSMNAPSASASALAANPAPTSPACPKVMAPKCPAAAPAVRVASAKPLTARAAAIWSGAKQRTWAHGHFGRHGSADADLERRNWDLGRPWPGDRPWTERRGHEGEGLTRGDRMASEHDRRDGLMGGPAGLYGDRRDRFAHAEGYGFSDGSRFEEDSRRIARSESSQFRGGERVIERYREEGRDGFRPCPVDCRGDGYRTFSYAGIDQRGYLVWPGKVEY